MKTTTKNTTRGRLLMVMAAIKKVTQQLHPQTKVAVFCASFEEENEDLIRANQKKLDELLKPHVRALNSVLRMQALEKDGRLWLEGPQQAFQYNKNGQNAVATAREKFDDDTTPLVEEFEKETVEVKIIDVKLTLPEKFDYEINRILNGFAYNNPNEFENEGSAN